MSSKSYSSILARPSSLYVGIDLGTSGCRAMAINASGEIKAHATVDYQGSSLDSQKPEHWWLATQSLIKDILSQVKLQHIQAISIDGTSGTVLLCDDNGQPLTPALMYNDARAKPQASYLIKHAPKESVVLSATSGLAKVLWLLEQYPQHQQEKPFHIVHQADWVAGMLSRRFDVTDINNALKTGFDAENKIWPLWLKDLFVEHKIKASCLPRVQLPGNVISTIHPAVATELDLPMDLDIVSGTTDSTAAFIASGAHNVGDAVTSLGSTLVLKIISDVPVNNTQYGVYSQPYGNHWLVGGASNSGGAVLRYYFSDKKMHELTEQVNPDVPTGLGYYPLLSKGERFPINDPELEAKLSPKVENDAAFFQGLLEGIADIELTGYQLLEKLGAPYPGSVRTTGGGSINNKWARIREIKLNVPVVNATHHSAAYGSALLAAKPYITKSQEGNND